MTVEWQAVRRYSHGAVRYLHHADIGAAVPIETPRYQAPHFPSPRERIARRLRILYSKGGAEDGKRPMRTTASQLASAPRQFRVMVVDAAYDTR